jgi:hypothetical protein
MVNINRHIKFALSVCLAALLSPSIAMADDQDFATDLGIDVSKDITKRWDVGIEEEMRLRNNDHDLDRFGSSAATSYEVVPKWLKLTAGYDFFADWNGEEKQYYTYRHRGSIAACLKHKVTRRLDLSFKTKYQMTYRCETYKTYEWNPKDYLRFKLETSYKVPNLPISPYLSAELFYSVNNPEGNTIDDMRYVGGLTYKFNKHNSFDLSFQIDDAMNVEEPEDRFMLCAFYKFKF